MWRDTVKRIQKDRMKVNNNRLRFLAAVIFLLFGALIYRLYSLQVKDFDLYTAMAAGQHESEQQIRPDRGRIYLSDNSSKQAPLYAVATNKGFASIFLVPEDITDPAGFAEKLYRFFDEPGIVAAVEADIEKAHQESLDAKLSAVDGSDLSDEEKVTKKELIRQADAAAIASTDGKEMRQIKRDRALEEKKEAAIAGYLERADKPGDPYEPLKDKVDEESLLAFYAFMLEVSVDKLELKAGEILYKEDQAKAEIEGVGFDFEQYRYYPEKEAGSQLLGYVSYVDNDEKGRYGLEEFFNEELFGRYGFLKSERGAKGAMIVNDREYLKAESGHDLILTVDKNIQLFACQKLKDSVAKHRADGGSVVAMDPSSGEIIAMCSYPSFDPNDYKSVSDISLYNNPAIFYQYEPGSVFKTITMAIAINEGKVSPSTTYEDKGEIMINGWSKPIRNSDFSSHGAHGVVDMNSVLENSLNTGAIFAMRQAGADVFATYVQKLGFGEKTGIELGSEATGNINNLLKKNIKEIDAATASFGQGLSVTPLQMLMSYATIANQGVMMKPYVVKAIVDENGEKQETQPQSLGEMFSAKTSDTVLAMLVNVVESGHAQKAAIEGYYIGGKTGTAQVAVDGHYSSDKYIHTFIGVAPVDNPKFVMLTKIDAPKDVQYAESSAVPLWRDIADFMLKYYQIQKTRQ